MVGGFGGFYAGQMGEIPDAECGDGMIGKTFAQIVGGIEMAVLDPRSLFQGMEETFDAPSCHPPAGLQQFILVLVLYR